MKPYCASFTDNTLIQCTPTNVILFNIPHPVKMHWQGELESIYLTISMLPNYLSKM